MNTPTFGQRLSFLRRNRLMSAKDLATRAQISIEYLKKIEADYAPPPAAETICALASALRADEDELFVLSGKIPPVVERELIYSPLLVQVVRALSLWEQHRVLDFLRAEGVSEEKLQAEGISRPSDLDNERKSAREPITAALKKSIFALDNYECVYCSSQAVLELDHIYPHTLGGTDEPENLVTCCHRCNNKKQNRVVQWPMVFGRFRGTIEGEGF